MWVENGAEHWIGRKSASPFITRVPKQNCLFYDSAKKVELSEKISSHLRSNLRQYKCHQESTRQKTYSEEKNCSRCKCVFADENLVNCVRSFCISFSRKIISLELQRIAAGWLDQIGFWDSQLKQRWITVQVIFFWKYNLFERGLQIE